MNNNLGKTSLKRKRRNENPLLDYDRLPRDLRAWIANAELPWRPRSVLITTTLEVNVSKGLVLFSERSPIARLPLQ